MQRASTMQWAPLERRECQTGPTSAGGHEPEDWLQGIAFTNQCHRQCGGAIYKLWIYRRLTLRAPPPGVHSTGTCRRHVSSRSPACDCDAISCREHHAGGWSALCSHYLHTLNCLVWTHLDHANHSIHHSRYATGVACQARERNLRRDQNQPNERQMNRMHPK